MFKKIAPLAFALLLTGCASVMNDTSQSVRLETKTAEGKMITGADCNIANDAMQSKVKSGDVAMVRRSGQNLDITCKQEGQPDATARAISRANSGMWGNILIGGGIGAIIDHSKGTAYTYPTWIQLIFGQSLVFDRSNEKEGMPVPATSSVENTTAASNKTVAPSPTPTPTSNN